MSGLADETERRSLTYTFWNHSTSRTEKQDWHPVTFDYAGADSSIINKIRVRLISAASDVLHFSSLHPLFAHYLFFF